MIKLLVIAGRKGVGKTSLADFMAEDFGFIKVSIDELKDKKEGKFVIDDIKSLADLKYLLTFGAKCVILERRGCTEPFELDGYQMWDGILLEEFNRDLEDLRRFASYVYEHVTHPLCFKKD